MKRLHSLLLQISLMGLVHPCFSQDVPDERGAAPALLAPVFQPGKTYRFILNTNVYLAPPGESPRLIGMEQQARYDTAARSPGQNGVALRGLTERLRVNIQSGGKTVSYDSLSKENLKSDIGKHFESTVNRYVKMELNEKMKVISHKEAGRSAGETPLPGLPRFGPEELVQIINKIPQGYSPDKVMTGEEWVLNGKRPVGELGDLEFEISYRHLGLIDYEGHDCIAIQFHGQMSGDITDQSSRNVDFRESQITGNMLFDPAVKMTRYSEHNVSMTVNIPDGNAEKKRPVSMHQKVVLKLLHVVKKK